MQQKAWNFSRSAMMAICSTDGHPGAALDDAGLAPADVGMVVAHGNGTEQSDASEARALNTVFGNQMPPVTAFKWAVGHPFAASGMLDAAIGFELPRAPGIVPGIATFGEIAPACRGLNVSAEKLPCAWECTPLVLCRGFAGSNGALLLRAAS